jgi:hypothetical protein
LSRRSPTSANGSEADIAPLSAAQLAMREHLEACGFEYCCTDSVDEAIEVLKADGILRCGFAVQ